ncbi:tripartite tricarboxylate transporter substrate binding protein [Noviherbaspirillum sp. CPCC 100848]|uniref:Tripartite tricarboxylate transporter substrate binding protein n=1 Tax=Noviherbaspirillum album TaxID=3080276 RepID=A0ABU6JJN4_9BURK|nr:tripartite tricarboxylate transporter substrate binding protein [Noviherbaspirillum sp. CPCC 100848]MEC4723387.1 tripartite tricarboxylate transporter substrate binding protein [Noviherbaspirillum sp. CPCC 100848]
MEFIQSARSKQILAGSIFSFAALFTQFAHAQGGSVLSLKVAYPAGGPSDTVARHIQASLQGLLGQTVIVENAPGASGSIAAAAVANATDANTLLVSTVNDLVGAPLAMKGVKYKPEGYKLVSPVLDAGVALVTNTTHNFTSIDDFIEQARMRNDKPLTIGTWGHGSATHLIGADFSDKSGVRFLYVPYKGAAPVAQALMSGEIDLALAPVSGNLPDLIRTNKVRIIGVGSDRRHPLLLDVPTINEGKYVKNFSHRLWTGVFAPNRVPDAMIDRLNKGINEAMQRDEYQRFIRESGSLSFDPMTPAQAASFYQSEREKIRRVAQSIKLEPQ